MHLTPVVLVALGTTVAAQSNYTWIAPSSTDRRSPCPMVNTLANHGFLPRDGLNISMDDLIVAFNASVNLASAATQLVGAKALLTSTTGNASTFNLDDLDIHEIIEHDGSLSRNDIYFGDNHDFNSAIWDSVATYFTEDTISIETAAAARAARLETAASVNPEFNMTSSDVEFSLIETALYLSVFGNITTGNAVTEYVGVLFTEERLPYAEGWTRPTEQLTVASVLTMAYEVATLS